MAKHLNLCLEKWGGLVVRAKTEISNNGLGGGGNQTFHFGWLSQMSMKCLHGNMK